MDLQIINVVVNENDIVRIDSTQLNSFSQKHLPSKIEIHPKAKIK